MNRLEIFQEVYGKDYMFTETELSCLHQVAELIVLECARKVDDMIDNGWYADTEELKKHFGVE